MIMKVKKLIWFMIIRFFHCFPVKKNKIFLTSYYGSQYGDNPKYITEYILKHHRDGDFDLVWGFNDLKSKEHIKGIRKVKRMSLKYFYELCTAKVVITNYRTTEFFIKRKNQYYIQTWHSSLRLKQIEKDAEDSLPKHYVDMAKKDSLKCDLLLSGCAYSTSIFKRSFWYKGPIFEHGTPRNDLLFQSHTEQREELLQSLKIPGDHKVILYAPTFRKDQSLEVYNLDDQKILDMLHHRYGGKWVFLVRLHPHLRSKSQQLKFSDSVIDVTSYDDIQQLLSIADVLITDYSSLMFDFSITHRPCFLYVPDLMDYVRNDRKLYFELTELPFICAFSNEDLASKIENFDPEGYKQEVEDFLQRIGSFEDGRACDHLLNHIRKVCFENQGRDRNEAV